MSVTFTKAGVSSVTPSQPPLAPLRIERVKSQVAGLSGGGTKYVYDLGAPYQHDLHTLMFERLTAADRTALLSFFDDTEGMALEWTYTDPDGVEHTVTFDEPALAFERTADETWSLTVALREEISS